MTRRERHLRIIERNEGSYSRDRERFFAKNGLALFSDDAIEAYVRWLIAEDEKDKALASAREGFASRA